LEIILPDNHLTGAKNSVFPTNHLAGTGKQNLAATEQQHKNPNNSYKKTTKLNLTKLKPGLNRGYM